MSPCFTMQPASAAIFASSNDRRGWKGLGVMRSTETSRGAESARESALGSVALGMSALSPLPKPFFGIDMVLSTVDQLLCKFTIILGTGGSGIIHCDRFAVAWALAQAHVAADDRVK